MDVQPAFIKGTKRLNDEAKVLFVETQDAYSFSRYGEKSWMANIKFLLTKFAPNQVEWILRSKNMRWAADTYESRSNSIPMNTMEKWHKGGNLDNDAEMPTSDAKAPSNVLWEKMQRVAALRAEADKLQREIDEA